MISQCSVGRVFRLTQGVEVGVGSAELFGGTSMLVLDGLLGLFCALLGFVLLGFVFVGLVVGEALLGLRSGPSGNPMVCRSSVRAEAS